MDRFEGVDFLELDSLLTPDELRVRSQARQLVADKVVPIIGACFERAEFPEHLVGELAGAGFLGANLKGHGCRGLNDVAYGLVMQELERGDSAVRTFASVQSALAMYPISLFGSAEQKSFWLPRLASGRAIGAFGLTEPEHGSDPASMETRFRAEGEAFVLNGHKKWIGNATIADVAVIWAKDEAQGTVAGFLVEKDAPGFFPTLITGKFSLRAAVTGEIRLKDCRVPSSARLPLAEGLKAPFRCLTRARYGIAWGVIGAAMACYCEAVEHAKTRIQFGRPIGAFQLVQEKLADMLTEITKMQFLSLQLGRLMEQGRATHTQVSMAKRNNVHNALEIARAARDILGAKGITIESQAGRHLCNLESVKTYEGTHSIHSLILGEHITGHRAFA